MLKANTVRSEAGAQDEFSPYLPGVDRVLSVLEADRGRFRNHGVEQTFCVLSLRVNVFHRPDDLLALVTLLTTHAHVPLL